MCPSPLETLRLLIRVEDIRCARRSTSPHPPPPKRIHRQTEQACRLHAAKKNPRCKAIASFLPIVASPNPLSLRRGLLLLQVLVGTKGGKTTEEHDEVETDAEAGALGVGGGRDGTGEGRLGLGVARLSGQDVSKWPS